MLALPAVTALTVPAILLCAAQAIRARRLLLAAMWLAGASAATALLLYVLGAAEIAAIELSVGAGLVTVLFVFAITVPFDVSRGSQRMKLIRQCEHQWGGGSEQLRGWPVQADTGRPKAGRQDEWVGINAELAA